VLGVDGVVDLIRAACAVAPETRLRRIVGELRRRELGDDTTLADDRGRGLSAPPAAAHGVSRARAELLAEVRAAVQRALATQGMDARAAARMVLAVDEACANIIRHAYRGAAMGASRCASSGIATPASSNCATARRRRPGLQCSRAIWSDAGRAGSASISSTKPWTTGGCGR
jgi:hypothetical protein